MISGGFRINSIAVGLGLKARSGALVSLRKLRWIQEKEIVSLKLGRFQSSAASLPDPKEAVRFSKEGSPLEKSRSLLQDILVAFVPA